MQTAIDASALLMAEDAKVADDTQLAANARNYFDTNFQNTEVGNIATTVNTSSTSSGYTVNMSATGSAIDQIYGGHGLIRVSIWRCIPTRYPIRTVSDCVLSLDCARQRSNHRTRQHHRRAQWLQPLRQFHSTTALTVAASAHITALSVGVVGNFTGASNITTTQGIKTGIGVVAHPYATSSFPAFSSCTTQNFHREGHGHNQSRRLLRWNETQCQRQYHAQCGIYYLDGGDLTVNGGATMTGSDVTLVFMSQNHDEFGTVQINGNATISLTALRRPERQPGS